jgi:uncharacterized protein (TIGR02001 family)
MKLKSKILMSMLAISSATFAQTAPAPAAPETSIAYNVGLVSQYRYRGLAQTKGSPALQGGIDYTNANGFYLGTWASTIGWIQDSGKGSYASTTTYTGNTELDLYGGYKFEKAGIGFDLGYLRYQYTGNDLDKAPAAFANANTDEVYAAATAGVYTLKYSYATSTLFGYLNSSGSGYTDISANYDLGNGVTFTPHVGHQMVKGTSSSYYPGGLSYTDYYVTFAKDLGDGLSATFAYITTNAKTNSNFLSNLTSYNAAKAAVVAGVKYTF